MVLEQPIQLQENRTDTVINPYLIAEVLSTWRLHMARFPRRVSPSKSTKDYDRSKKFRPYQTIETFQEYLLIDQHQIYSSFHLSQVQNKLS